MTATGTGFNALELIGLVTVCAGVLWLAWGIVRLSDATSRARRAEQADRWRQLELDFYETTGRRTRKPK